MASYLRGDSDEYWEFISLGEWLESGYKGCPEGRFVEVWTN